MLELLSKNNIKPLLVYKCGSSIYGLETEKSDADFTVIAENYEGQMSINEEGVDFFIFGIEHFKKFLSLDSEILIIFKIWLDNIVSLKQNIVYIEPSFNDELNNLINIDWNKFFYKWLSTNLDYYEMHLENGKTNKILWGIYRLNSITKNYLRNGKFSITLDDEDKNNALDFKANETLRLSHYERLKTIFSYLRQIAKEGSKWQV